MVPTMCAVGTVRHFTYFISSYYETQRKSSAILIFQVKILKLRKAQ